MGMVSGAAPRRSQHGLAGLDRERGVLITGDAMEEQADHAVTHILVDHARGLVDRHAGGRVEAVEERAERGRADLLGDGGRAAQVGEEDRQRYLSAARMGGDRPEAIGADPRVAGDRPKSDQAHHAAAPAGERRLADLAARRVGEALHERLAAGRNRPSEQELAPVVALLGLLRHAPSLPARSVLLCSDVRDTNKTTIGGALVRRSDRHMNGLTIGSGLVRRNDRHTNGLTIGSGLVGRNDRHTNR
jgi:hypothetical protein